VALAIVVAFGAWGAGVRAARTDVVTLVNGDRVTGEIKSLQRGILTYKTDSAGTLAIEWADVTAIRSMHKFNVETVSGGRFYGSLEIGAREEPSVVVVGEDATADLYLANIVRIAPVEQTFLKRIDGSLSLGFSYTKASEVSQLNSSFRADYRARKFLTGISYSTNATVQPDRDTTSRYDATYYFQQLRRNRWFTRYSGTLQSNSEIGLDLRAQAAWTGGRYLIQTESSLLLAGAGLAVNRELRRGQDEDRNNVELVLTGDYEFFRFKTPKRDASVIVYVYPSLSDWGRVRTDTDVRIRFEIVADLSIELSGYHTYDSRPPPEALSGADYGGATSLSWTF
jgi:hypothetical protein